MYFPCNDGFEIKTISNEVIRLKCVIGSQNHEMTSLNRRNLLNEVEQSN